MRTTLTRIGIGAAIVFFLLAAVVVVMFALGKPTAPQASATPAVASQPPSAPAAESDPLAIQIPGCVCHSDDSVVVAEHASYRMSQCFDCHKDGVPGMGQ
jgi:hypothetical protein